MVLEVQMIKTSSMPNRNKVLIDLLQSTASMTENLARAFKLGLNTNTGSLSVDLVNDIIQVDSQSKELLKQLPRLPIPYMAKTVQEWFNNSNQRSKEEFLTTEFDNLVVFMSPLGAEIINHFNLWLYPWTKDIKDGIDRSPQHPEAVALQVIEEVWRSVNND